MRESEVFLDLQAPLVVVVVVGHLFIHQWKISTISYRVDYIADRLVGREAHVRDLDLYCGIFSLLRFCGVVMKCNCNRFTYNIWWLRVMHVKI